MDGVQRYERRVGFRAPVRGGLRRRLPGWRRDGGGLDARSGYRSGRGFRPGPATRTLYGDRGPRAACRPITWRRDQRGPGVGGAFGVFAPGRVQVRAGAHVLLERPAGPLESIRLDDQVTAPESSAEVELVYVDAAG